MVTGDTHSFIPRDAGKGNDPVMESIYRLNVGVELGESLVYEALRTILTKKKSSRQDTQLGILLNSLLCKKPTPEEVVGAVKAALSLDSFDYTNPIRLEIPDKKKLVGAVGSGKKGFKTMNISTLAMIVAASTGVYTAKPGSSSTSSVTGSNDILKSIGVNTAIGVERMSRVVERTGFGLFPIEGLIPNFDRVYGGKFFAPHVLSLALPAILSPVKLDALLYGLAHPSIEISVKALKLLDITDVMVVSTTNDGIHYLDELGIYGTTKIKGIQKGKIGDCIFFEPTEVLSLPKYTPEDISQGVNVQENVRFFLDVLQNKGSQARIDVVRINAGTLIYLAGEAADLQEGFLIARKSIVQGKAIQKLLEVIEATNGDKKKLLKVL